MNSISKIKNRIAALLQKEIDRSNAEIQELLQKQHDNMASYGIGGPYSRYERAIERRGILISWNLRSFRRLKDVP